MGRKGKGRLRREKGEKEMKHYKDRIGERHGRLLIVNYLGKCLFLCVCDCGKEKAVRANHLVDGKVKSCGCLASEMTAQRNKEKFYGKTHGESKTRLYKIWLDMKQRCHNPKQPTYKWYGAKGIKVCDEWKNNYLLFKKWAMENGYTGKLTIDRINTCEDYSPNNCRFITMSEQARNKSTNIIVEIAGKKKCLLDWCKEYGKNYGTVVGRVRCGWHPKPALFAPKYVRKGSNEYEKYIAIA